jgi:putative MATE family efflux protein
VRSPVAVTGHDREIFRLALPALGALAAEPLYVLVDTAVVGRLGTPQQAGLGVASGILLLGYAVFIFLAYGTTAAVARLVGAGDERRAAAQAVQSMWLAVGLGVVVAVAGWVAAPQLVRLMQAPDDVVSHALVYLRISLVGVPAMLLVLAGTGFFRGLQDARTPLVVAAISVLANLVIELVLIFGLGYGIGASALSTVLAQTGAASAYVWWVGRDVRRRGVGLRPDPAAILRAARVGRDLFVRTAALRGSLTVATAVAAGIGTVEVAAHTIAFELWSFLALVLDAIAIAGQAIVGRMLGAGLVDEARAIARRMLGWGVVAGVAFAGVVGATRYLLPELFTDDPEVVAVAAFVLVFVALLQPVNGAVFVLDGVLIGAGDMRFLAWAMAGAAAVFLPAAVAVAVLGLGIGWLWAALGLLMVSRLVVLAARFAGSAWLVTGAERAR